MESFTPNKNSCQFQSQNEANESNILEKIGCVYSKTYVKRPLSKRQKMVFIRPIIA